MNRLAWLGIASVALFAAIPAHAQRLEPQQRWNVMENMDRCSAIQTYGEPGQSDLIIHEGPDKPFVFTVSDARWEVEAGEERDIRFLLDGQAVPGRVMVMARPDNELPGYAILASGPLHARFAAASTLRVYRRDELIADLSLGNIGEAMKEMTECLETLDP